MTDTPPQILIAQGLRNVPQTEGMVEATNLIVPPMRTADRLAHMPDDIYDLSAESHLTRLLKVLLGDVGVGRLEKAAVLARLQHSLHGSHFFDLDRFYGALFGAQRLTSESFEANPYEDVLTDEEWEEVGARDDSYRSRVEQLARAINYGATPTGMELAAEALLGCDVDIYESFVTADRAIQTYADLEAVGTYGDLEAFTYGELEAEEGDPVGSLNRTIFTVVPKREITDEERYSVIRVLSVLKPAASILRVSPLGQPHLTEVAIRDVAADSEMWRIIQRTPAGFSPSVSKERPPFTAYQGEAWSHIPALAGVASYSLDPDGSISQFHLAGTVRSTNAQGQPIVRIYTPDLAISPLKHILGGRAVSDGILVRHPLSGSERGNPVVVYYSEDFYNLSEQFRPQVKRNVFTDGYYILDAGQPVLFGGHAKTSQDFWATPERNQADDLREVVEKRLRSTRLVNYVSMELARFPHRATIEAFDDELQEWVTLHQWTVRESFPERIPRQTQGVDRHPQHSLSGHFLKVSASVATVRTERLRVVLQRGAYGDAPKDSRGDPLAYSLAVRNWDSGYRIRGREDIPEPDETLGGGFATTIDSQGNTVILDVVENLAASLVTDDGTWRSEPQPTNRSVVSAYLDVRTPEGDPQVIDAFRLDPTKSGPHLNLYWADQVAYGSFVASDDALDLATVGVVSHSIKGISFSDSDPAWIAIDNSQTQFAPAEADWWMGIQFMPFTPTTATDGLRILFTDGAHLTVLMGYDATEGISKVGVLFTDDDLNVTGAAVTILEAAAGEHVTLSVSFDQATSTVTLAVKDGDSVSQVDALVLEPPLRPETLYLGGHPTMPGSDINLEGFFLKVGAQPDPIEVLAADFHSHLLRAAPARRTNDYTANSIIRYSPAFSTADQIVIRGGAPRFFESLVWHPVERDYKLMKGFIRVPSVLARYWKFEFTNLVPEPMESFLPIHRHVRVFPPEISGVNSPRPTKPVGDQWPGLRPAMREAANAQYRDTPFITDRRVPSLPPTAAQYVTDIQQSGRMRGLSWLYGFQPWQVGHEAPRWREVGTHTYDEFDIVDTAKIGYFVGLRSITAYRTDFRVDDDTQVYRERFQDQEHIGDAGGWTTDRGYLYAEIQDITATSEPFRSRHGVRAVQFASTQSDAVQILEDDDFTSEGLSTYEWDRDDFWHSYGDSTLVYSPSDNSVLATRAVDLVGLGPGGIGVGSDIMEPPLHPVFTYDDGGASSPLSGTAGGIESAMVTTSPRGMLHAAVRATALTDTGNPLVLQIIGSDDSVLAESEQFLKRGETKEWYVSYQLGAFDRGGYVLFERRGLMEPPFHEVTPADPPTPTGDTPILVADEAVRVRLIQQGASTDSWKVDRLSLFDDSMLWEFSNDGGEVWYPALDIRNNPDGVLVFPSSSNGLMWRVSAYRPGRIVSSLQIRPWYDKQMGTVMGVPHRGPNLSAFDHDPPIESDPEFRAWHIPVPRWWWREGQRFPILPVTQ